MRRTGLFVAAVLILLTVTRLAMTRTNEPAPAASPASAAMKIEQNAKNPWTHLEINDRPDNFQFAIVTDRTGGHRPGVFQKAVEKLNLLQPEFVLSVGDLIEGYSQDPGAWALEWSEFENSVRNLQMPFFFCPGNHDISNVPMSQEWSRKFGRSYYHFVYRDCLFLVLNSEDPPVTDKIPYQFSEEQRRWAAQVLAENKDVRWTFVFMHKPTWTFENVDHAALGWTAIEDALQGRKYSVFAGHKHVYARYIRKGMEYYMLATTGGSSKLTGLADGRFDHFVWVTMKDQPVIGNVLLDGVQNSAVRTQ